MFLVSIYGLPNIDSAYSQGLSDDPELPASDPEPQTQQPPPTELKDNDPEPQTQQPPPTELKDNENWDNDPESQLSKSAGSDFNPDSKGILNNDTYIHL